MDCTVVRGKMGINKEKLDILLIFIASMISIVLIKDINKYKIFVHGIYATFLIAMAIIVFNSMKFNINKFSIFLGIAFTLTGILEVIYVFICLSPDYNNDFIILLSILVDLLPIVGIYESISYIGKEKDISEKILRISAISIMLISFVILFMHLIKLTNSEIIYKEVLFYIEIITNIFIVLIAIFINCKIKKIDNKLNNYEKNFLKKITILIALSQASIILAIFIKNLYIEELLKQTIYNTTMYYLYRYIIYTNVKKPYLKLNHINNELTQKSKKLNEKNKKLIEETEKIEQLKKMLNIKEIKLQSTLDTSVNCIIVFNHNREITYVNKTFTKSFETSHFNDDYKMERDIKPILKNYDDFIANIDYVFNFNKNIENIIYTKDNKVYYSILAPLVIKNEIQGTLCILIDRTKKKEFKEKVIDINKRYERFLESIGDGIIVIQDGKKIYVNKACREIFKDELDKINFKVDYNNDNVEECYEIDGKKVYVEMSFSEYTKNNENKTIIVIRNITNRKKAQIKLKESQKSYSRFIDILPDGICLLNRNLEISYANQSLLNMLKINDINKIRKSNIKEIINLNIDEDILFDKKMKTVINENKYVLLLEYELITYDKNKVQVELNALPFSIDENKNIMLIIKDLTHKKTSEMAEKELLDRLKTDKIKTEFFANMSHELKTPLNVISSSNQLVDSLHKSGKIKDYNENMKSHIELVKQNSYRLQRLITNIIDLTKMESGFYKLKLFKHNIVNVVEDLFMKVEEYARKKDISIIFDTDNEEIYVNIDKVEIERIMLNLLSNCIKFTNNGGHICVNIYDKKESVTISVKDSGVGIPKNKIDIIFEEFGQVDKTLSRNTEGSGIGLTIVKNLVELHQGSINVKSEKGKGTEFIINIPITNLGQEDYKEDRKIYNIEEKIKKEFSDIYY